MTDCLKHDTEPEIGNVRSC